MSDPIVDAIQDQLKTAQLAIAQAQLMLAKATNPPATVVKTPEELDAALAGTAPIITLATTLVYPTPITVGRGVTIQSEVPVSGRATLTTPMPSFSAGLTCAGSDPINLLGVEVKHTDPLVDVIVLGAGSDAHRVLDGCRVLGQPYADGVQCGAKRGVAMNVADVTVVRCYVEDCFQLSPGNDSQALAAWDSPGPFLIQDNYLSGGSETVLFGGADPASADRVPSNIRITGNTVTKRASWKSLNVGVKNVIELKNAQHVMIDDNDISQCWGGHGQDGYLIMLTPRNQDGGAPYSLVHDVTIRNNRLSSAAGLVATLGHDSPNQSGPLSDVVIEGNDATDIDPWKYAGADKMVAIFDGPVNVTINGNKVAGDHVMSWLYFDGSPKAKNLVFTNNTVPACADISNGGYGVMGASCAPGHLTDGGSAWQTFVDGGTISGNVMA